MLFKSLSWRLLDTNRLLSENATLFVLALAGRAVGASGPHETLTEWHARFGS